MSSEIQTFNINYIDYPVGLAIMLGWGWNCSNGLGKNEDGILDSITTNRNFYKYMKGKKGLISQQDIR